MIGCASSLSGWSDSKDPSARSLRGWGDSQPVVRSSASSRRVGRARRLCTQTIMPNAASELAAWSRPLSEEVGDFVDRVGAGLVLVGEALGELAAVTLTLCLEADEVA